MIGVLLMIGCTVVAQDTPRPSVDHVPEVRRLIRQLDSPQLERRNEAEAALIKLGPDILPLLPAEQKRHSAEVWQRLGRVRQALEQQLAKATVEASRVTIVKNQIKLSELLKEIERQTDNRIIDARGQFGQNQTDPTLNVDFDKTPFWTVMDEVMDQADLTVYPFGAEQAVYLVDRPSRGSTAPSDTCTDGPFRFVPVELISRRMLNRPDSGTLRLGMLIMWEPRMTPIGLTQKLSEVSAVDEKGTPLSVESPSGELDAAINPKATAVRFSLPFDLPPRDVRQIAKLTSTIDALVPGRTETFRFDGLPKATDVQKRVASATVTLKGMHKNNDIWEVTVNVRFDEAGDALASHRGWIFANEAYLEGPDGKRLENEGFETKMQTENEVGLAYFFFLEDSPDKYKFIYKTPSRIFPAKFKYQFDELDLP